MLTYCIACCCSVAKLCLTPGDPMDCSTSDFLVLHCLPKFAQTHVHWVSDVIQPSHPLSTVTRFSSCPQSFPASRSSQMSWIFIWDGQSIGTSASASELPMNIQDWFPLGWTSWIFLQSKGLSRVFSNTTVQKHQFFNTQFSLWSVPSHPYMTTGKIIALTTIRVVSSAYLSSLIFFLAILIPACVHPARHFTWRPLHIS